MKKHLFFLFLVSAVITACNNNKNDSTTSEASAPKTQAFTADFYKRLEGTIAGKPVVMHLQGVNGDFGGNYYYDASWLNLSTDTLIGQDSLVLAEYSFYNSYFEQNPKEPGIALKWTGNGFKGTWKSGDGSKSFPAILEEKYPKGSYQFTTGIYQDSVKAYANKANSPSASITFKYLKAKNSDDAGNWLNSQLKKISGLKPDIDLETSLKATAAAYLKDYSAEVASQPEGDKNDEDAWLNYTNNSQQSILYNDNDFIVIDFLADSYTGGAHGNYNSQMYCLDAKRKKQMVLSDIVTIDSNNLQKLLERNLRKQYNIKSGESLNKVLFDDFLKPNNNFYFNDKGLAFMYNPYEVASYAQGQIVVFIPFNELKSYLVPAFAERIRMK
ncbi:DUF3298 domain-containing protein [Pedobacter petrophilus]|uniref:DUF3298 domain-containing protein n=1 Tax=Pedobacter petrophilus TaxID=1908241 RepID=A0A7K0FUY1_9SPHI|nr:DUF3298 and DUF4163 domain-containing protein [Pedobacter petrophilus]MRX75152.1 DUF3298 domain-containing protein [Pedobacter petrophilus]